MATPNEPDPAGEWRGLSVEDLARLGEEGLKQRLLEQAIFAHRKYGPLTPQTVEAFLADPECARYPTRLVFESGAMAGHQFAQPGVDPRPGAGEARVLYLRPRLRERPELVPLAVAYMLPVINYGEIIGDEHCLLYGAALLGLMKDEFYRQVCALADEAGCDVA